MPVHRRPVVGSLLVVLIAVLVARHAVDAAQVLPVSSGKEFLDALSGVATSGEDIVLEFQTDIFLSPALAATSYTLPFTVPAGRSISLQGPAAGVDDQLLKLGWGQIEQLLSFQDGSALYINRLNVSGMADPQFGTWPDDVGAPYVSQTMPFWPTVVAAPGYMSGIADSYVTLHPTPLCDPQIGASQFAGLQQLAEDAGSNATELYTNGTVGYFVDWAAPIPVLSPVTKVAIGTVDVSIRNTSLHCSLPEAAAPASAPAAADSSGGGGGGGVPVWVWPLVVLAIVPEVVILVVCIVRRRRRRARMQLAEQAAAAKAGGVDEEQGGCAGLDRLSSHKPGSDVQKPGSDGRASGSLGSGGLGVPLDSAASVPEGPWRSRVGFIEGLQLGGLLGRGGFARVYKGRWKGMMVAVKVVDTHLAQDQRIDLRSEPLLSLTLSHPNVLQAYKMCAVKVLTGADGEARGEAPASTSPSLAGSGEFGSGGRLGSSGGRVVPHLTDPGCMVEVMPSDAVLEPGMYEMWLVQELADKNTLADALQAGWFDQPAPHGRNHPAILLCLLDIARGLEYLHSCSIVHGDLKPQNVLLKTAGTDRRGYVCKLGDFGLSRMLQETETHVNTGSYGTVTHAAPELLSEGRLTKSSDVFAFGMLLWELVTGDRLFPDMHTTQIIVEVTQKGYRPPIAPEFPPQLASLAQRCWAQEARDRPTAEEIVESLMEYSTSLGASGRRAAAAAAS